jgi:hypothetical protein
MKILVQATAALLLASLLTASGTAMPPGDGMRPPGASPKSVDLAGKISDDAKSFLADDGNRWTIINVAAVKGREGRNVVLQCRMDLEKHALHVFGIRGERSGMKKVARLDDSAFRR